ncbi:MAG: SusC/RagA family TonB-linked outer membrane protein [Saprospiraceae bacterium]|nr:MAG: SusC/RagA family TonB-linked outer membrane protein [Saprospiraceae bacterium]
MKLKVNYFSKWLLLVMALGLCNFAIGQRTVKGTVIDESTKEPLIGANILVVGTSTGTITDFDGAYSLNIPENAKQLEISYTGYSPKTIAIGPGDVINITLSAGELLEEVVVVGYGSVRKTDATGAVTSVTEEDFNKGVITSPEQLIQGRAAGVQITTASGEPGAGVNIRIRGTSSVRGGNNPLFVVDGVPLSGDNTQSSGQDAGVGSSSARNPLNFLNPNDIASIDILKDASATAIYGSRGANGVVIITTKSGKSDKGVLDYSYSLGISNITKKYDLLGRDEFLDAYASFNGATAAAALDGGADTDWQDEILRTGLTNNHNVSYGSGNESGNYRFSFGYFDQEGILKGSGLTRYNARFNGSKKFINDRLTIGTQITIASTNDQNIPITDNSGFEGDLLGSALKANPTQRVRDAAGKLVQPGTTEPNPVAFLELSKDFTNTLRALGNLSAELQLFEGLSFKTVIGFDQSVSSRKAAFSRDLVSPQVNTRGRLFLNDIEIDNKLWENYFTYNKDFGNISFTGLLGYSYQSFDYADKGFEFVNFRTSDLDLMINNFASVDLNNADRSLAARNSSNTKDELQSYFGRVNLGFADKYIITATLRADGSTRFGGGNKYGYFPSFAFKWRLIEESFVPDFFSDLGLRIGYGITGNQEIPHNLYQPRQRYNDYDINDGSALDGGGLASVAFANPNLKWETTSQINIGLDFSFFNHRLSGSLDYYNKNTNDLLIKVTSAQPAVAEFVWDNLDADVVNTGVELSLNLVAVDKNDLKWEIASNVAFNKNEVQNFGGLINTGDIDGQGLTGAFAQRIAEGQPLFAYFLREFAGYDAEGISVYEGGDVQKFVGKSPIPKVNAGLTNTFGYKNWDFSFFFNGQFGNYIYSNTANAYFTAGSLANARNVTKDVVGNGESNLNAPDVSTRFLENGSFVRLQNVSLGYVVNTKSTSVISSLRFFVSAQNLFVITDYSGQDPEVNVNKALNDVPSLGIDYTAYPRARTITIGANISF